MEKQTEKIRRFSRVIYILCKIAWIALIVAGALQALSFILSILKVNTELITVAGAEVEAPLLFKLGNTKVYLPMMWIPGYDVIGGHPAFQIGVSDLLLTVFSLVGLMYGKRVFRLLRDNGTPFREDVVTALKKLAIALLVMGAAAGYGTFLAAGIVWVLCMIFDYGRALQYESDTTL
jgi:hypothetical protein